MASEDKASKTSKVNVPVVTIDHYGDKLTLPTGMSLKTAIEVMQRAMEADEQTVAIDRVIQCFPWDGAIAMMDCMKDMFGWVSSKIDRTFWGETVPQYVQIPSGVGKTTTVLWGRVLLPGVDGYIETSFEWSGVPKRIVFKISAQVKAKYRDTVNELFNRIEARVQAFSIYKGQSLKTRFIGENGKPLGIPELTFLDMSAVQLNELVFSSHIEAALHTNLYTLIQHTAKCKEAGVPLKRGILLAGPYGTGKSMAAYTVAKLSNLNGWTYLYCSSADELAHAVRFAHHYQPAIVFCEDIDNVVSGNRDTGMNEILNLIDGIESKGTELLIVLTTNHPERITKAMLRPGRLDAIIHIEPPDAEAVERLIKKYAGSLLHVETNADRDQMTLACGKLAGKVPAVIRECVERAKLSAIKLSNGVTMNITPAALLDSVNSMAGQFKLMNTDDPLLYMYQTKEEMVKAIAEATLTSMLRVPNDIQPLKEVAHGHSILNSKG